MVIERITVAEGLKNLIARRLADQRRDRQDSSGRAGDLKSRGSEAGLDGEDSVKLAMTRRRSSANSSQLLLAVGQACFWQWVSCLTRP